MSSTVRWCRRYFVGLLSKLAGNFCYFHQQQGHDCPDFEDLAMSAKISKNSMNALDGAVSGANSNHGKLHGLSWFTAALFIVADMAGGGVVAMPGALLNAGTFGGAVNITVIAACFCYTAHLLGVNWNTMCQRWPMYRDHCRKPYPEMAYRALGKRARYLTSLTLNLMLFGVAMVYLSLSAKILAELVTTVFGVKLSTCMMIPILALLLLPVTLCKSPADFQLAVVAAMMTTTISVGLIFVGISYDHETCGAVAVVPQFSADKYVLSLGTFMFSFGGHGVFPTIQHDMKEPQKFTKSAVMAFFMVLVLYLPITVFGYATYGDSLVDSIINSIQSTGIQQAANFFIAIHCILTLTIVINPLNQEVEHKFKLPHGFGTQRIVYRSAMMFLIVVASLTCPKFGPILNFIGGTSVALTSAIMPCMFYLYLHASNDYEVAKRDDDVEETVGLIEMTRRVASRTNTVILVINISVIVLAIFCGGVTTYSAIHEIAGASFGRPCWWPTGDEIVSEEPTYCCGTFRNVSSIPGNEAICSL